MFKIVFMVSILVLIFSGLGVFILNKLKIEN